ncbi:MAG: hypothetical protein ACAH80_03420 [Alphaproteobacteria bacterium]
MFEDTKRAFRRAAKNWRKEPLTLDDISTIRPMNEPGSTYSVRARRQFNSAYWKIYGPGNLMLPRDWSPMTLHAGLTLPEALDKLAEHEKEYEDKLRGKEGRPYNHFTKIRAMMEAEEAAKLAAQQAASAPPPVETKQAVAIRAPLVLKKQ